MGPQEKIEKETRVAEMEANKLKNLVVHEDEIHSRPAKTYVCLFSPPLVLWCCVAQWPLSLLIVCGEVCMAAELTTA